ncbi:MAG: restriction endonuclease subunit S [Tannerellaceae bacterium]|nr:restriction endonuclease subunit S [Tannerellaceae bacterium]
MRFPEFQGEWEKKRFSDIAKKNTIKNKDGKITNVISNSAQHGLIPQLDFFDKKIANDDNTGSYFIIEKGDFVYNPRKSVTAPYGPINMYCANTSGIVSPSYLCFKTYNINRTFLFYYFKSSAWHKFMYLNGDNGARHDRIGIKDEIFFTLPIKYPKEEEQERIVKLFTLLDERIATQSKIIEKLESLIIGISDSLFCGQKHKPALRFAEYKEEWKKVKLKEIVSRITRKNKENETELVLTIAAQHGLVDQYSFFNKQIASNYISNYYLLYQGEFAYNKSYSKDYPWGAVKRLDLYEKGVLSTLYICFKAMEHVNTDYLAYYFETNKWYREISEIAGEGARNHGLLNISIDDYFETAHFIPSYEEQQKIASFLGLLYSQFKNEQSFLENLQKQKRYLMLQMFI